MKFDRRESRKRRAMELFFAWCQGHPEQSEAMTMFMVGWLCKVCPEKDWEEGLTRALHFLESERLQGILATQINPERKPS